MVRKKSVNDRISTRNLHTVIISLMNEQSIVYDKLGVVDTFEDRFGLRQINTCGNFICLNEQPIKLKGYNRHEIHHYYGPWLPKIQVINILKQKMYQEIMHLKNLHGNFFRLVHCNNFYNFQILMTQDF